MSAEQFIGDVAHRLRGAILDPLHERPVEFEVRAARGAQEAADILRVAIASVHPETLSF